MGVDLRSDSGEEFRLSPRGWCLFLNLAEEYGWKPNGTTSPKGYNRSEPWHRRYDSNDGQRVELNDAYSLADALEKALESPDVNDRYRNIYSRMNQIIFEETGYSEEVEPLTEEVAAYIRDLIRFSRCGSFLIW
jgi:hypothetical protein